MSGVHLRSKPTHNEEGTSESKTQNKEKSGGTSQKQGVHFRSKPTDNEGGTSKIETQCFEKIRGYISNVRGTFKI